MFRVKVVTAIAVMLFFALALAAVMVWSAASAQYNFQRSYLAHQALESYLEFSLDAFRHFKERLDVVLFEVEPDNPRLVETGEKLWHSLDELANVTRQEIDHVAGSDEHEEELKELDRVNRLEMAVWEGLNAFDMVERMRREGRAEEAHRLLYDLLERTFDERLRLLVDEAVADERSEVRLVQRHAAQMTQRLYQISTVLVLLAVLSAMVIAVLLWRNVKRPIDELMQGTRSVATGDLGHRIAVHGHDEFAELAIHFNQMAGELHRNETQLREARSLLEDKVRQRTGELQQANAKLMRMDEVRRQFFADISHELRTPLTIIRGEAEITLRGGDKGAVEYRTSLGRIVDLTGQLTTLVGDLLFLARAETRGARLALSLVDLNDLMLESWEDAQMLARHKQLHINLDIATDEVKVHGDRVRLKQLMHILIDNACKYSRDGGVVEIGLDRVADEAVIRVRDEGIGIKNSDQDMVFERFYRGDDAKRASEGSGLGLPMARAIVEAHRGVITVHSAVDQGTTFSMKLPVSQQHDGRYGDITG